MKRVILLIFTIFCSYNILAKDFFDCRNVMIGISGDTEDFARGRVSNRIFINNVPISYTKHLDSHGRFDQNALLDELNNLNVGKQILDYLFMYNGNSLSEERLKERALKNASKIDIERAAYGVIDSETILKEDYYSILNNNYVFFKTKYRDKTVSSIYTWILFKLDITKELVTQIYSCWNSPKDYNKISVKLKFVAKGDTEILPYYSDNIGLWYVFDIAKTEKSFALRSPVQNDSLSRRVITNLGKLDAIGQGRRIEIYRQYQNQKGKLVSRKINTSRAVRINDESCTLYPIAGIRPSEKKGDIAVDHMDNQISHNVAYFYQNGSHSIGYEFDMMMSFTNNGCSHHWISNIRFGLFNENSTMLYDIEGGLYQSPSIFDIGTGYGFAYHFAYLFEIMGTINLEYEGLKFSTKSKNYTNFMASSLKTPLGIKISCNLVYPLQLYIGAEYTPFLIKFQKTTKIEIPSYTDEHGYWHRAQIVERNQGYNAAEKYFLNPTGYKRTGLCLYAGIRVSF